MAYDNTDFPNTGALFRTKEKKHPQAPDMFGDIKFDKAFLLDLIENSTEQLVTVKLGAWTKEGKSGKFLSMKVDNYKPQPNNVRQDAAPSSEDDLPF